MIRSYALAFAAVTLRIYMPLFAAVFHIPGDQAYAAVAWVSWVPNLIFAEHIINKNWVKI